MLKRLYSRCVGRSEVQWLAVLIFIRDELHASYAQLFPPSVLSKGWAGTYHWDLHRSPSLVRRSGRIGGSPWREHNNSERQSHDGETVADGNVLPRNTRTSCVDGAARANGPTKTWQRAPALARWRISSPRLSISSPPMAASWARAGLGTLLTGLSSSLQNRAPSWGREHRPPGGRATEKEQERANRRRDAGGATAR